VLYSSLGGSYYGANAGTLLLLERSGGVVHFGRPVLAPRFIIFTHTHSTSRHTTVFYFFHRKSRANRNNSNTRMQLRSFLAPAYVVFFALTALLVALMSANHVSAQCQAIYTASNDCTSARIFPRAAQTFVLRKTNEYFFWSRRLTLCPLTLIHVPLPGKIEKYIRSNYSRLRF
jgi:hypothetical protein